MMARTLSATPASFGMVHCQQVPGLRLPIRALQRLGEGQDSQAMMRIEDGTF
jgi:hypothetical protein